MPTYVDQLVQEANVLHGKAVKYQTQLGEYGITPEELANLITARDNVIIKDTTQKELDNAKKAKTKEQNATLELSKAAIKKIKNIAKIVYSENKEILKEFHVGEKTIQTVKKALTELAYMKEITTRRKEDLMQRGLKEEDITQLNDLLNQLTTTDTQQEMSKREKVSATSERGTAINNLKKIMLDIRKTAELCFAENPDIRQEFRHLD